LFFRLTTPRKAFTLLRESNRFGFGDNLASAAKPGDVFAVWSSREDRRFEQRLRHVGFNVTVERVRGRLQKGVPRHTIFIGVPSRSALAAHLADDEDCDNAPR
jgi:hypothetical protein